MLRRFSFILILLAVTAAPAAALRTHHRAWPTPLSPSVATTPHTSTPEGPTWLAPAFKLVSSLVFLFGAVPGILARNKDMPNWKRILVSGIIFGFLFFPIAFFLLYRVLKYEKPPVTDQASFRPDNHVKAVAPTPDVTVR